MKRLPILALVLALVGCGSSVNLPAQQPQTAFQVNLTWTPPTSCSTASPCTYILSRATIAAGSTQCPATTGSIYLEVGVSNLQAVAWTDTAAVAGQTYCYIAQTVQAGATGPPSAPSNVVVIPMNPSAPGTMSATIIGH